MNEHEICFITCVNKEDLYAEAVLYLRHLHFPHGMGVAFLPVRNARSMAAGYAEAMRQSTAKYKVYLHQDVLVLRKDIVQQLLDVFRARPEIGLIGLAGCAKLPESSMWWKAETAYGKVAHSFRPEHIEIPGGSVPQIEVEAIDGVFMATQYDVPWRSDLFRGWDFYDISQSMEFHRHGYKILLLAQDEPFVLHQTKARRLGAEYEHWLHCFQQEYRGGSS